MCGFVVVVDVVVVCVVFDGGCFCFVYCLFVVVVVYVNINPKLQALVTTSFLQGGRCQKAMLEV